MTGNLQAITGQEIYRQYQDRKIYRQYQDSKSTGNNTTGNLQAISGQEIYRQYQESKSTGNIRS